MKETTCLTQRSSTGNIKCITLNLDGDTLDRAWGILNGAAQTTSNTYDYINKGKANELDPSAAAQAAYERIIKTKTKEGYLVVPSFDDIPEDKLDEDIMDLDNIPTQFCCSKPTSSISEKALDKLIKNGNDQFQLKYNGLCHYILIDSKSQVKIYTRRMDNHTVKYPAIVKDVEALNFPARTLFITEFVIDPELDIPHMEGFRLMSQISKSNVSNGKPKKDLTKNFAYQKTHRVRAAVFGVLYYDGGQWWDKEIVEMLFMIKINIPTIDKRHALFVPDEISIPSAARAIEFCKENKDKYEGLVAWDLSAAMEVTFNGKPKRRAAFKIKPTAEMDVIAFGFNSGTGKLQGKIGSLQIGKYNADGSRFDMGDVGSGLKPLNGDCEPSNWTFPCVIEVEYDQVFPTGKLQFPRFVRKHPDKTIEEIERVAA